MKSPIIGVIAIAALGLSIAALFGNGFFDPRSQIENPVEQNEIEHRANKVTVYKSPTCGCCEQYAAYLKREGYEVEIVVTDHMESIKEQYGVPHEFASCHTSVFDGRVVEGHVPVEAVRELVSRRPEIRGIALPGMPSGSPGMPGAKRGAFRIMGMHDDDTHKLFMEL